MSQQNIPLGLSLLRQSLEADLRGAELAKAPTAANLRLLRPRSIVLCGLALFLVWAIVTKGLAAYLAEIHPEAAIWLQPRQPTALTELADRTLHPRPAAAAESDSLPAGGSADEATGSDVRQDGFTESGHPEGEELNQVRIWAELALIQGPLNARALRILGQVALLHSDEKRASMLLQAAADSSRHEGYANYWTMAKNYEAGDYPTALHYADILLRTKNVQRFVMPVMAKLAEAPQASQEVKELLAKNPPWRSQFLAYLPSGITDARTPLEILLSLKNTATPPVPDDLRPYLAFLVKHNFHELAYHTWLQFLPPEQLSKIARLFNGDFQTAPSGMPFDWVFKEGSGVTIQLSERSDQLENNALRLEFGPGRVDFGGVTQMVLLPPGGYQLSGTYRSELVSDRGLLWRISCSGKTLGESHPVSGSDPAWKEFRISFTVPEEGCPAQEVKLVLDARSASETFVSGSIWYDDFRISADQRTQIDDASITNQLAPPVE